MFSKSNKSLIYLDQAAGAVVEKEALKSYLKAIEKNFANPAAIHKLAQEAASQVAKSRQEVADILGVKASQLLLLAGGSQANQKIIETAKVFGKIASLETDHDSVRLFANQFLPIKKNGQADYKNWSISDQVSLVSLAGVNNEIGVYQPISKIGRWLNDRKKDRQSRAVKRPLFFHVDGAQMANCYKLKPNDWLADFLTLNGRKFGSPNRVGLLYFSQAVNQFLDPDRFWPSGSQSVASWRGLSKTLSICQKEAPGLNFSLAKIKARFEAGLSEIGGRIVAETTPRSPQITNCLFPGYDNERLVLALSRSGIMVGLGSACHSQNREPSPSLVALGYQDSQVKSSLRFSFGREIGAEELAKTLRVLKEALKDESNKQNEQGA